MKTIKKVATCKNCGKGITPLQVFRNTNFCDSFCQRDYWDGKVKPKNLQEFEQGEL